MKIYIAGPMRGIPWYNRTGFTLATNKLRIEGHRVINPHEEDEKAGFKVLSLPSNFDWSTVPEDINLTVTIQRCLRQLQECDAIYLLDGWEQSKGATAEKAVADWLGLEILYHTPPTEVPAGASDKGKDEESEEDILDVAARITRGDRNASYGPVDQDFQRIAKLWSALKGVTFEAREVAMFMICVKLSRETHQRKRDNWIDMAGYARCGSLCRPLDEARPESRIWRQGQFPVAFAKELLDKHGDLDALLKRAMLTPGHWAHDLFKPKETPDAGIPADGDQVRPVPPAGPGSTGCAESSPEPVPPVSGGKPELPPHGQSVIDEDIRDLIARTQRRYKTGIIPARGVLYHMGKLAQHLEALSKPLRELLPMSGTSRREWDLHTRNALYAIACLTVELPTMLMKDPYDLSENDE